jgi:hypothetical protein
MATWHAAQQKTPETRLLLLHNCQQLLNMLR